MRKSEAKIASAPSWESRSMTWLAFFLGTIARTATNVRAGARGPVSGMLHALFLLAFLISPESFTWLFQPLTRNTITELSAMYDELVFDIHGRVPYAISKELGFNVREA